MTDSELNQLSERIIGCGFNVSNTLGVGFLEKVYQNAMVIELRKWGLKADPQHPISVYYEGIVVGEFYADILVNDTIIVELKATALNSGNFTAQCLNYLRASGKPLCLLLNFAYSRLEIKRVRSPYLPPA